MNPLKVALIIDNLCGGGAGIDVSDAEILAEADAVHVARQYLALARSSRRA